MTPKLLVDMYDFDIELMTTRDAIEWWRKLRKKQKSAKAEEEYPFRDTTCQIGQRSVDAILVAHLSPIRPLLTRNLGYQFL